MTCRSHTITNAQVVKLGVRHLFYLRGPARMQKSFWKSSVKNSAEIRVLCLAMHHPAISAHIVFRVQACLARASD